jgi:hypothetical protein
MESNHYSDFSGTGYSVPARVDRKSKPDPTQVNIDNILRKKIITPKPFCGIISLLNPAGPDIIFYSSDQFTGTFACETYDIILKK